MRITLLAKHYGLTRSALLHYDRIGLLRATGRTHAKYREYTAADIQKLETLCLLRKAGISLKDIGAILQGTDHVLVPVLEQRLMELEKEITVLRSQQRQVAALLKRTPEFPAEGMDWETWVEVVKAAGFTLDNMRSWHEHFERLDPERHRRFLHSLGIPKTEWQRMRSLGVFNG